MRSNKIYEARKKQIQSKGPYQLYHWTDFDYTILQSILYKKRAGRGSNRSYNDIIIMADTETSKKAADTVCENHVVAWTISLRAFDMNIATLYGHKPTTCIECIRRIHEQMSGSDTFIYFHNLSYDWVFLRKFFFSEFGHPEKQLNTKSHYPIYIAFENGIILRDSLILAQRNLEKWAKDMDVEHKKAVGMWDYDKVRGQNEQFTADELEYIEHDTLAGVECIQKTLKSLNKSIYSIPYTATGIPREETRIRGKENGAHEYFLRMNFDYTQQQKGESIYHGGYTHANRHFIDVKITEQEYGRVECRDFASSYPFIYLSEKMPIERFTRIHNCSTDYILRSADDFAFMFTLILIKPRLKDDFIPMPALQYSKCTKVINPILDNGRILAAGYVEIPITELDLEIILSQYDFDHHICTDVEFAAKGYVPRWFTDYIFDLFKAKTELKGQDPVLYSLAKAKLNSLYGMCVQKPVKPEIVEEYLSGEYVVDEDADLSEKYDKWVKRKNTIMPYQWGIYCTAYAFRNLFRLGACCKTWIYSDTDSCYGIGWDEKKLKAYNDECKRKLKANGYGSVYFNGKEYWLGVAEFDGAYTEFKVLGAKRYCGRSVDDGKLHITVAGVPKKGAECLDDNIDNFTTGFIFNGIQTGKKTHTYFYVDDIYTDRMGNITGDSIDLSPCDYLLDSVNTVDWEDVFKEEIEVRCYE